MTGQITITLEGKPVLLNFCNYSYNAWVELTGKGIGEALESTEDTSDKEFIDIVYSGMVGERMVNSKPIDFTIEDVQRMCAKISIVDKLRVTKEFFSDVLRISNETMEALKYFKAGEEKKK